MALLEERRLDPFGRHRREHVQIAGESDLCQAGIERDSRDAPGRLQHDAGIRALVEKCLDERTHHAYPEPRLGDAHVIALRRQGIEIAEATFHDVERMQHAEAGSVRRSCLDGALSHGGGVEANDGGKEIDLLQAAAGSFA